ncbi:ATP synthase subunit gamma, mitochondrial [Lachnellula subtilissima]|uniref:ATP synthase subunit gamma n=1 Tax=Lachnellula subtilissima TaxID=602034 RepID=A0A8H8RBK9_9HELO|nr:ATP synthase subunit gamma, mitochondrial [Lachnellula subtilissima]
MLSRAVRPALKAGAAASVRPVAAPVATFATLREIEQRLKSISNIEKITKTMKIVASTKLNRAQRAMTESRQYGKTSNTVFEQAETKPLESEGKKTLIVVSGSDKGLCGGIHSGLSKQVRRMLVETPDADIVVLGEKCKAQLSRSNGKNIVLSFSNVGKNIPTSQKPKRSQTRSLSSQRTMLPFRLSTTSSSMPHLTKPPRLKLSRRRQSRNPVSSNFSAFEIDDEVLTNFREYALSNTLFWALAEGHACEISARRNAMDNASKNAGDMISKYQILYNRTRQAVITGELVEIITGASASED